MRNNSFARNRLPKLSQVFAYLREQEEKEDTAPEGEKEEAEPAADDLFGEEEEDAAPEDEAAPEDDAAPAPEEEEKEEEDDKIKVSAADKARLAASVDDELESLFVNYETDARKVAAIEAETMKVESLRRVYRSLLREVAADDIDLRHFANNLARLVKNYDTLMDMESIILNKAYSYIQNNYGDDTVKALKDVLEQDFDIEIERVPAEIDEPEVPIAVGAISAAA